MAETDSFRVVSDITKEYPNMVKVIIYHENYTLTFGKSSEQKKTEKKQKKEDHIHRSLRRSKAAIKDIMLSNRFDLWCTFTYNCRNCEPKCKNNPCICSPATCKRFDVEYTHRTLRNWFRNQKKHSPSLSYLAVPEFHKNGAIHFHCLMSNFNGALKDSGKKTKNNQTIYNASGYYSGWTEFVKIGENADWSDFETEYARVSSYITKYITKDMPMISGRHRYIVSKQLSRPIVTVNGISKFNLWNVVSGFKPDFINEYIEVQTHKKVGGELIHNSQSTLF